MTDFVKINGVWVDMDRVPRMDYPSGLIRPPEPRTPRPPKKTTALSEIAEKAP